MVRSRTDSTWLPGEAQSLVPGDLQGKIVAFPGNREGRLIIYSLGHLDECPSAPLLLSVGTVAGGGSRNEPHSCLDPDVRAHQTSFSTTTSVVRVLRTQRCAQVWTRGEVVPTRAGRTRWRPGGLPSSPHPSPGRWRRPSRPPAASAPSRPRCAVT